MTPRFQRFFALVNEKYAGNVPQSLRDEFRAGSLPLMKWANILTFNTRAMVLYVVVLTGVPWVYFLFEVTVMNALFFYMRNSHEALCTRLTKQLEEEAVA
jgi:Flp pilus assembly protein TadB